MHPQQLHFGRPVRLEAIGPGGKRVPVWSEVHDHSPAGAALLLTSLCGTVSPEVPLIVTGPVAFDIWYVETELRRFGYRNVTTERCAPDRAREALRRACHLEDDPTAEESCSRSIA